MRYNIPQFIDTEDRIVGPLTLKQFGWFAAGGGVIFLIWMFARSFTVFLILSAITVGISAVFAFRQINGKPFIIVVMNFFKFTKKPKIYLWRKK